MLRVVFQNTCALPCHVWNEIVGSMEIGLN
jgi:hypothetical protein